MLLKRLGSVINRLWHSKPTQDEITAGVKTALRANEIASIRAREAIKDLLDTGDRGREMARNDHH